MTALDRFVTWLTTAETTDDQEIIEKARSVDERLVEPVTAFLSENSDNFDDTALITLVRECLPDQNRTGSDEEKIRVFVNSNITMSRGKMAAHVAHAVLQAADVHPDVPVVVLGAKPRDIEKLSTVIRDAGATELKPGTLTAGTDWTPRPHGDPSGQVQSTSGTETVDMAGLPLPELLEMAQSVADRAATAAPAILSQTIRELVTRLEAVPRS